MSNRPEKRVLLFLAEGFEDLEAVCVLSACGWTQYRPHLDAIRVSVTGLHERVHGRFGMDVPLDIALEDVDPADYDALAVPGGFHDHGFDEAYCQPLRDLARTMHANGAVIVTMCVGILPIAEAGLLEGGRATTYSFSRNHDNFGRLEELGCTAVHDPVVCWNRIVSCSGPGFSEEAVALMLEHLVGTGGMAEISRYRAGID